MSVARWTTTATTKPDTCLYSMLAMLLYITISAGVDAGESIKNHVRYHHGRETLLPQTVRLPLAAQAASHHRETHWASLGLAGCLVRVARARPRAASSHACFLGAGEEHRGNKRRARHVQSVNSSAHPLLYRSLLVLIAIPT